MIPQQDVTALAQGNLDDAGKVRLRQTFLDGQLPYSLAVACESVEGWVWTENPAHLARMTGSSFGDNYLLLTAWFEQARAGSNKQASFPLSLWVEQTIARHEDGALTFVEHAVLQSTPGWSWTGNFMVPAEQSQTQMLEQFFQESGIAEELQAPPHVGYEFFGRIFHVMRVGFKRARTELFLEEFRRWNRAYPGYPVPEFVTSRGLKLGRWVSRMQRRASLDLLDAQTFALLSDTPGWSWGIFEQLLADDAGAVIEAE